MAKIIGIELKDEAIFLSSVIFSFLVASILFYQCDLLYMISGSGFQMTAENTLSLLTLLTILASIAAFVVFVARVHLGAGYYQVYASLTIVITAVSLFLYVILFIMIFVYSSGRTLTQALWIIAEKVLMIMALGLVGYLHWVLKSVLSSKDSIFHEVGTNQTDNNLNQESFEMETRG